MTRIKSFMTAKPVLCPEMNSMSFEIETSGFNTEILYEKILDAA